MTPDSSQTIWTDFESIQIKGDHFSYSQAADSRTEDSGCTLKATGNITIDGNSMNFRTTKSNSCNVRVSVGVDGAGRNTIAYMPMYPRLTVLNHPSWSLGLFLGQEAIIELSVQPQICPNSKYQAVFTRIGSS